MYRNVGIEDKTNVEALVEVFDGAGNEVSATSASLGTVFDRQRGELPRQCTGHPVHRHGLEPCHRAPTPCKSP